MRVLLFGANGQVGWELQRSLVLLGNVICLSYDSIDLCGDLTQLESIRTTIQRIKPDVIVNAAAYTSVDKAEQERDNAYIINAEAVKVLAEEAEKQGILLVHYSTDYVFDGSGDQPKLETDLTAPLNVYGLSKLAGEQAIQSICSKYLIFRTSWVYAARGNNFIKTMLDLARKQQELSIVNDQFGAPTGAELLADCTAHAIKMTFGNKELYGVYHLTASGTTTWYKFANFIFQQAERFKEPLQLSSVKPILTDDFPRPAIRPLNSRLNTVKFENSFSLVLPNWRVGVERVIQEILGK